jgi:tetratricopeptide (TPR) repeat protein
MTNDLWNAVWERVGSGGPVVVVGLHLPPSVPSGVQMLPVSCDAANTPGGPLEAARRQITGLLGGEEQPTGETPGQLEAGLRVMSLEHARAAELAYQRLGQYDQLARVWETMGRLELQRGQHAAAWERLSAALDVQRRIGDVIGLARSTASLADLCGKTGRLSEAAALLADSVNLNFQKGSPLGLAVNRRALEALTRTAAQEQGPEAEHLRSAVAEIERRLAQAESILGRTVLPGVEDRTS